MLKRVDPSSLGIFVISTAIVEAVANLGFPIIRLHPVAELLLAVVYLALATTIYRLRHVSHSILRRTARRWGPLYIQNAPWAGSTSIRAWQQATINLISEHKNTKARDLVDAFLETYATEEARHLSGDDGSGKHQVYTSFASYAALVRSIVEAAKGVAIAEGKHLICFTTLALPLPEWFNFHIDSASSLDKDGEPAKPELENLASRIGPSASWDSYISYMHSLIHPGQTGTGSNKLTRWFDVYRVILVKKDFWKEPRGMSFATATATEKFAKRDILVYAEDGTADFRRMPPKMAEPGDQITWDGQLKSKIAKLYKKCCPAYVIADHALVTATGQTERKWVQLGDAFACLFHQTSKRCFIAELGNEHNENTKTYLNAGNDIPPDFFLIGLRVKTNGSFEAVDWLFGLGTHVIREDDSVTVDLLSEKLDDYRWQIFVNHAKALIKDGEANQNDVSDIETWMERRP